MTNKFESEIEGSYIAVHPMLIRPWVSGSFSVYLRHENNFVLYTNKGQAFTKEHSKILNELNPTSVFIPLKQKPDYEYYLRENMDSILTDKSIPMEVRAQAWFQASISLVHNVFDEKLPKPLKRYRFVQIKELVRHSLQFFTNDKSLPQTMKMISKGYKTYNHALATMVLTTFLLLDHPKVDERLLIKVGVGAILHDMGKASLDPALLTKDPETFSAAEREIYRSHPNMGVGLCMQLPLSVETHHCILFHHEVENGTGYPSGLTKEMIPPYLKALVLANAYDQMTRATPWRPAMRPFEALQRIESRLDQYDQEFFKRLISVLSKGEVIGS